MIWFTADWHFFHDRILDFHPKRKEIFGNNMKEVTEKMIQKWNSRIDKHDTVYILGDFAFGTTDEKRKLFQRLNGNKVLILGNHDKVSDNHRCFFNHITQIKNMTFKKTVFPSLPKNIEVIMCHHCHGSVDLQNSAELPDHIRIDVGIDSSFANYDFVSIDKLANFIKNYIKQ